VYVVDGGQPVMEVKTGGKHVGRLPRAGGSTCFCFLLVVAIGLSLALFGVYGVIANTVAQRTRDRDWMRWSELSQVMGMILSVGVRLLSIGVAAGLGGQPRRRCGAEGLVTNRLIDV
jgi:hypothetical protein